MKYLNSATQQPKDAVGHWMHSENPADIDHLRFKSGYFTLNGLSSFKAIIGHITASKGSITAVIGANGKDTIQSDLDALLDLIQHPSANSRVAVAGFSNALFHPKVYHLTRTDGSQLAYVGSANLTPAGITGLNIETGILLDTRDGDNPVALNEIASSIDGWFTAPLLTQSNVIGSKADIAQLVADGLLGVTPPTRQNSGTPTSGKSKRPSLKPLFSPPPLTPPAATAAPAPFAQQPAAANPVTVAANTAASSAPSNDVLVAEIGKGERWKQANFPKSVMQTYFGVNPLANEHVDLIPVDSAGASSPPVDTQVVHVKSVNFRIELTSVNGIAYPTARKPIAVFRRTRTKEFRYHVYMPGDVGHGALETFLNTHYVGRSDFLKRVVTQRASLMAIAPPINV